MSVLYYTRPNPRVAFPDPTKEPQMEYRRFVIKDDTQTLPAFGNWITVEELHKIMHQFDWIPTTMYGTYS